jgi:glycosyltransferase involved in cell wall biosynthesis
VNRPLRIAIIADRRHPVAEPFAGGLEAHVWHLATALRGRGHEVTLFAGEESDPHVATHRLRPAHLELSRSARRDPSMPAEAWMQDHHAYLELMLRLGSDLADSFDVVHNHSLHFLPVAMASVVRASMITTLHTPPTPWLESAIRAGGAQRMRFVAVSAHNAGMWRSIVPNVSVAPNGVDCRLWPAGFGGDGLIWFGRITPEKAPHLAIAAARRAGLPLRLAGPIHDRRYFDRQVQPALSPDVVYLGHLRQKALAAEVGRAAVTLVTPVWDEPYGLVVAESLACGTPVVAFDRGGIPEILTAESGEVVPRGDVEAMAAAALRAARLSRADCVRRAESYCDLPHMVDTYLGLYADMLASAA